jgi:hypothetical protein
VTEDTRTGVNVPVIWDGIEDVSLAFANQVLGQVGPQGEVILTFGQITPPILVGKPEQQAAQVEEIPFVAVKPVARLALTKAGLDDLVRVLRATQENHERAQEQSQEAQRQTEKGEEQ